MNINSFFQTKRFVERTLLIVGLTGFNMAIAGEISDAQLLRAAKIARDTGTIITITKEVTTFKVTRDSKKPSKTVKKTVVVLPKQKKTKLRKTKSIKSRRSQIVRRPPALENSPPSLNNHPSTAPNQPPGAVRAPVLDSHDTSGFY